MLKQLKIENFRCFKSFEINHLGKVNLLVGENNSGKTSIIEAIQLLCAKASFNLLAAILHERGEYFKSEDSFNISHFFNGHTIDVNKHILISGEALNEHRIFKLSFFKSSSELKNFIAEQMKILDFSKLNNSDLAEYKNYLKQELANRGIPLDGFKKFYSVEETGKLYNEAFVSDSIPMKLVVEGNDRVLNSMFVSSSSLAPKELLHLFNQVVLTSEEDLIYQALQTIEPDIQRIAPIGNQINSNSRGGFFVRLKNTKKRVPIGSMGDGIWRMLGLSLALVSAKDGVLLVDEIDTGLHYTALEDMWKLIWETSKKLNVQVFATTHNSDCWKALEALTSREDVAEGDISIQRIEKDAPRSVAYNKKEIATAVERETEVR